MGLRSFEEKREIVLILIIIENLNYPGHIYLLIAGSFSKLW